MRLVDHYKKNKIIPTVNLQDHSSKILNSLRDNFYFSLNISEFKEKTVLELCPGTGWNANYLLKQGIKSITAVDLNKYSLIQTKKNLKKFSKKVTIINKDIYKYFPKKKFDIVIIENVLTGMDYPEKILKKIPKFVKKKGFLIFTVTDEFGWFSEKLRGLLSFLILNNIEEKNNKELTFQKKCKILSSIFVSHLKSLKTNTRKIEKYIQDNMLQNDWWSKNKLLPLDKASINLSLKKNNLAFWSISPNFLSNYLWYKKINSKIINDDFVKVYNKNKINLLDIDEKFDISQKNFYKKIKITKQLISEISIKIEKIAFNKKIQKKN